MLRLERFKKDKVSQRSRKPSDLPSQTLPHAVKLLCDLPSVAVADSQPAAAAALVVLATNGPAEWENGFNPPFFIQNTILQMHTHTISWTTIFHRLVGVPKAGGSFDLSMGSPQFFFSCSLLQIGTHSPKRHSACAGHVALEQTLPLSLPPKFAASLVSYQLKSKFVWFQGPPLPTTSVLLHCDLVSCNQVRIDLPIVQWRFFFSTGSLTKILEIILVTMK